MKAETAKAAPMVSILIPTKNRHWALPAAVGAALGQSVSPLEVIVFDSSPEPLVPLQLARDPRLRYAHTPREQEVIGAKRNEICDAARGDVMVFFDDDDFYHSRYVEDMLSAMIAENAVLAKLVSFFCYHVEHGVFGHYDLRQTEGRAFDWNDPKIREVDMGALGLDQNFAGYSSTFVFEKALWRRFPFPELSWNEDAPLTLSAIGAGERVIGIDEIAGRFLRLCHASNISRVFPYQFLPPELVIRGEPELAAYLRRVAAPLGRANHAVLGGDGSAPPISRDLLALGRR